MKNQNTRIKSYIFRILLAALLVILSLILWIFINYLPLFSLKNQANPANDNFLWSRFDPSAGISLKNGNIQNSKDKTLWVPNGIMLAKPEDFEIIKNQGYNFFFLIDDFYKDKLLQIHSEIAKQGAGCAFQLSNPIIYDEKHGIDRSWDESDLNWILPIINQVKDSPCLQFYYIDEPIGASRYWWGGRVNIVYNRLVKLRSWLHQYDPKHPLWVNFDPEFVSGGGGHTGLEWVQNTADLVSMDYYPFRSGLTYGYTGKGFLNHLYYLLSTLKNYALPSQPIFNIIQCWANSPQDFIKPQEVRATAIVSMLLGLDGYMTYGYEHKDPQPYTISEAFPDVWQELRQINKVIKQAGETLATGKALYLETGDNIKNYRGSQVKATLYTSETGKQFLVVMNLNELNSFNNLIFTVPEWAKLPDKSLKAKSLFGAPELILESGGFKRSLSPIEGDVYEIVAISN